MRRSARFALRSVWFAAVLIGIGLDFLFLALRHGGTPPLADRTRWLSRSSRRTLNVFNIEFESEGPPPTTGLLVSNHLSYLDILVYSSLTPAAFVSKSEVMHWPVFGWYARMGGTVFVRRDRRLEVGTASEQIRRVMDTGQLLVLFPEGTSTNGREILPFKSSLLEPATNPAHPLSVGYVTYTMEDGSAEDEVCYWGDIHFVSHFLNLMTKKGVQARVRFAPFQKSSTDRKQLAQQLYAEVSRLKDGAKP